MNQTLRNTIAFMRAAKVTSGVQSSRHFEDFFSSRVMQCVTEPTLLGAMEKLTQIMGSETSSIGSSTFSGMIHAAGADDAGDVLHWLRAHTKIAAMLTSLKGEDFDAALGVIQVEPAPVVSEASVVAPRFDIGITAELLSPLSHGADTKAGNATLFRRRQAITPGGSLLDLPFYGGNALRGQIRDLLADHFLQALGLTPRRDTPPCVIWFFHMLYAGGVLEEQSKASTALEAINATLGNKGALRTDGVRLFRDTLPGLSLLGAAVGNKILPGRIYVSDLRPHCREWGLGDAPASTLMGWEYLTRRDDYEGRGSEDTHRGMIATTEVLKAGVVMSGGIDIDGHATELERSALGTGLDLLARKGLLGADNRRGFGKAAVRLTDAPDPATYNAFLAENKAQIIAFLNEMGALNKIADISGGADASGDADPSGMF